jgi:hypothetical protein
MSTTRRATWGPYKTGMKGFDCVGDRTPLMFLPSSNAAKTGARAAWLRSTLGNSIPSSPSWGRQSLCSPRRCILRVDPGK